jgi:DNA repair photolyase
MPTVIDDDAWRGLVVSASLNSLPRHGRRRNEAEPIVIFNRFLYEHGPEERARRREKYPELFEGGGPLEYSSYGGWDWRSAGDEDYRRRSGLICQPAYAMHSIWGCHFRCTYCNLGHVACIYTNLEDWLRRIQEGLANLEKSPRQRLFQWDNGTDAVCWEPEYGATRMLVEFFAKQPDKYLELYVGKSDQVDFMLGYEHKGHTVCCWSLGCETQCRVVEPRSASMEARIASARKCQEAGYHVRIRLSPMVPIIGWREEDKHMLQCLLDEVKPDMITIEPLRFCTYDALKDLFEPGVLDPEFMDAMSRIPEDAEPWAKSQLPEECRMAMYRLVFDEVARLSPRTPVAFCREKRHVWDAFAGDLSRTGQHPDDYVCNCGPVSAGCDARLQNAVA